jgi:hypothetical protein
MDLNDAKSKWSKFVSSLNDQGVPVPMIRDPKTGKGSVSLTLVFVSFNVCLISFFGRAAGFFGGVSQTESFNMFLAACGLYFGRKFQKDGSKVEVSEEKKDR